MMHKVAFKIPSEPVTLVNYKEIPSDFISVYWSSNLKLNDAGQ